LNEKASVLNRRFGLSLTCITFTATIQGVSKNFDKENLHLSKFNRVVCELAFGARTGVI
jgi:predicted ThiF/HesA family dinucleotide-utilizing enzyme